MTKNNLSAKDFEKLGRIMVDVYESGYVNRARALRMHFIMGVFRGLGTAVGATIVVGIIIWLLSLFDSIPFVNTITQQVRQTISEQQAK